MEDDMRVPRDSLPEMLKRHLDDDRMIRETFRDSDLGPSDPFRRFYRRHKEVIGGIGLIVGFISLVITLFTMAPG
jgi:hypothetical protein